MAGVMGTATAGELDSMDSARYADSNDYSAKVFYKLDFGGPAASAQSVGLRFDNERAAAFGAPAVFQAKFDGQSPAALMVNGVDLRGAALSAGQASGGGFFSALSVGQWIGIAFTGLVFTTIAVEAGDDDTPAPVSGTGGA